MDVKSDLAVADARARDPSQLTDVVSYTPPQPSYNTRETTAFPDTGSRSSLKREDPFEDHQIAKHIRRDEDEPLTKPEPAQSTAKLIRDHSEDSDFDSLLGDNDLPAALERVLAPPSAHPSAPFAAPPPSLFAAPPLDALTAPAPARLVEPSSALPSLQQRSLTPVSGGQLVSMRMHRLGGLESKATGCYKELQRIADDVENLQRGALDVIIQRNTKWLIEASVALGEQREAVTAILNKTIRKQEAKKRRLEKQRRQEAERERQLEAKRVWNKQQIEKEGGSKVPHVDITKTPAVKMESRASCGIVDAERQPLVKREIIEEEPQIKAVPNIKVEED
ncbi:hypothetical protein N0V86_008122 [Didymella sp. IMI 355093]|nr:hypothetical protein N0V86_008122 [Didymella sp. IMI 355093]